MAGCEEFEHITCHDGRLRHNSVSALAFDGEGRAWAGTWGGGVDVLEAHRPFSSLMSINAGTVPYDVSFVGALVYDPINNVMFIASNAGLLYYDGVTGMQPAIAQSDSVDAFGFVGSMVDSRDQLWLGSARGLLLLDLKHRLPDGTFSYRFMRQRLDDESSESIERPTCFCETPDGSIWIGTNGHGIYRGECQGDDYEFVNYTSADGLSNNIVRGILCDGNGCIWVSTINGLSCYNPNLEHFNTYTTADGLMNDQFYWNSAMIDHSGDLLFGNVCGLEIITPSDDGKDERLHNVVFTSLFVDNKPVSCIVEPQYTGGRSITSTQSIFLHEIDKSFTVEFSSLDIEKNDNAVYQYRLMGFDNEWITVPTTRRRASYTNLSPGTYTLEARYLPDGENEMAPISRLKVIVRPLFYKTWWFILFMLVVIAGVGFLVYRYRIMSLTRQRKQLKIEVERSTAQIAEQKQLAERRATELAERNSKLVSQNEEINRQKVQLTEMNRQVSQLTMDRIQFFTNLTHELRTPITLIIGPIERALKLSTNPRVIEQLHFVDRNSKYLLTLVNQLMDFRKVESGKMGISYTRGNLQTTVEEIVMPFLPMARERNILVKTLLRLSGKHTIVYDEESLRKILINLLSNAIKYTPDGGHVTVYVALLEPGKGDEDDTERLYMSVSDTGNGIQDCDLEHVFDRFYQGENALKYPLPGAGDSGIGLYVSRQIVELHGGTISVRNNCREGCVFRVMMPLPQDVEYVESQGDGRQESALESAEKDDALKSTVLVVDDNADMRRYVSSILRDYYRIEEACNGEEALNRLGSTSVDIIISDLMMPGIDGIELSRRVKENFATSHIPFLMLTAKTATDARIDSYRIGVDDYLLKPFDDEVLLARVQGILRQRRRMQHNFSKTMDTSALDIVSESRDKKFVDSVMETVKANYRNSYFEVGDFANTLGISRSLLNKKLQSLMGQSTAQLMKNYRLNMARELIMKNRKTKAMNISEIAYEVGFNDSKYFTRCFTKMFGVTPSAMMTGGEL